MKLVVALIAATTTISGAVYAQEAEPSVVSAVQPVHPLPGVPKRLAKILAKGDGLSARTAYKVANIGQEYQIVRLAGFEPMGQSLVTQDKPFDVIRAENKATGEKREFWFDISSFFGRMR